MWRTLCLLTSVIICAQSASARAELAVIDLLVLYSPGLNSLYEGGAATRINHLVNVTNQIYADSGVNARTHVVNAIEVDYSDVGDARTALTQLTLRQGAFSEVEEWRDRHGADMVVLMRPYDLSHNGCGQAWVGGNGTEGNFDPAVWSRYMASHVSATICGDYVLAHELGHNMGLTHSRLEGSHQGGTFDYALGFGVERRFATIMASTNIYRVDYWSGKAYKFSNPMIECAGLPCGIERSTLNRGADAAHTLSITAPQISAFKARIDDSQPSTNFERIALENGVSTAARILNTARAQWESSRANYRTKRTETRLAQRALRDKKRTYTRTLRLLNRWKNRANRYEARWNTYKTRAALLQERANKADGTRRLRYLARAEREMKRANDSHRLNEDAKIRADTLTVEVRNQIPAIEDTYIRVASAYDRQANANQAMRGARSAYLKAKLLYRAARRL